MISERGVSFQESGRKKGHSGRWEYQDIQELWLSPGKLVLVTYEDRKWRLGADQEYEFTLAPGRTFQQAYRRLKNQLDQRFVAALPDPEVQPVWEIPVKLLGRIPGSEGVLQVGPDRIVYKTEQKEQSRTWRYRDIENISTSGPFQLTVTTYERSPWHYGNLKCFNFQLKQPLEETRYNFLWRRLTRVCNSSLPYKKGT